MRTKPNFSLVLHSMFCLSQIQYSWSQESNVSTTAEHPSSSSTDSIDLIKASLDKAVYPVCIIFMVLCFGMTLYACLQSKERRTKCLPCFFKDEDRAKIRKGERWEAICDGVDTLNKDITELLSKENLTGPHRERLNALQKWATEFDLPTYFEDPIALEILDKPHVTDDGHSYNQNDLNALKTRDFATPKNQNIKVKNIIANKNLDAAIKDFLDKNEKLLQEHQLEINSIKASLAIPEINLLPDSQRLIDV